LGCGDAGAGDAGVAQPGSAHAGSAAEDSGTDEEYSDTDYGSFIDTGSFVEAVDNFNTVSFDLRVAKLTDALWPAYEQKFVLGVASSLQIPPSSIVITPRQRRRRRLGGNGPTVALLHVTVNLDSEDAAAKVSKDLHTHGYTTGLTSRLQLMGVEIFDGVDSNVITIDPATIKSSMVSSGDGAAVLPPSTAGDTTSDSAGDAPDSVPLSLEEEVQSVFEQAFYSRDAGLGYAGYSALAFTPPHDFSSHQYYTEVVKRVAVPLVLVLLVLLTLQIMHRTQKPRALYRLLFDRGSSSSSSPSTHGLQKGDDVFNGLHGPSLEAAYDETCAAMTPMPESAMDSSGDRHMLAAGHPQSESAKWHLFNGLCKMGTDEEGGSTNGSVRSPRTGISGQGQDSPYYMVVNSQLNAPTAANGVTGFALVEGSRARIEGEVRSISMATYRAENGSLDMHDMQDTHGSVLVFDFRIVEPCKEALVKPSGAMPKSILASWGGASRRLVTVSSNGALQCRDGLGSLTINRCPGVAYVGTVRDEYPDVNQDTHIEIRLNSKLSQKGMVVGIICYPGPIFHDGLTLLQGEIQEDALVFEEAEVLHTPTNTILVPVDYHLVLSRDAQTAAGSYQYAVDGERGQVALSLKNHTAGGVNSPPKLLSPPKSSGANTSRANKSGAGCLDWLCCMGSCSGDTVVTPIPFDTQHSKQNVIRPGALYHLRRADSDGVTVTCSRRGLGSNPQDVLVGGRRRGGHSFWTASSAGNAADEGEQWVVFDLGEHRRLVASHYTLQSVPAYSGEATSYPMNLEGLLVEGTNSWDAHLRIAVDGWQPILAGSSELIEGTGKPGDIASWAVDPAAARAGGYSAYRVRLPTEYGTREGAVIALGGIELYGKLLSSSSSSFGTPVDQDMELEGGSMLGSEVGSIAPSSAPSSPQHMNYNDDSRAPMMGKWADADAGGAKRGCSHYYGLRWNGPGIGRVLLQALVLVSLVTFGLSLYSGYHGLQVVSGRSAEVEAAVSHAGGHFTLLSEYGDQMLEASGAMHDGLKQLSTTCSDEILSARLRSLAATKGKEGEEEGEEAPPALSTAFKRPWERFDEAVSAFSGLAHQLSDVAELAPMIGSYSSTSYVGAALPVATSSVQALVGIMALNGYIHPSHRAQALLYMASFSYLATFINAGGVLLQASSSEVVTDFCAAGEQTALYYVKSREMPPQQLAEVQNVARHIASHELTPSMTMVIKGLIEGQAQMAARTAKGGRRRLQLSDAAGGADSGSASSSPAAHSPQVDSLAVRALREAVFSKYLMPPLPLTDFLTNVARCKMDSSQSHELYNGKNSVQEQMAKATAALRDLGAEVQAAAATGCGGEDSVLVGSLTEQAKATSLLAHAVTSGAQCTPLHSLWVDVVDSQVCDLGLAAVTAQTTYAYAVLVLSVLCAMLAMAAHRNWMVDSLDLEMASVSPLHGARSNHSPSGYEYGSDDGTDAFGMHALDEQAQSGMHQRGFDQQQDRTHSRTRAMAAMPATPTGPAPLAPLAVPASQPWRPKVGVYDKFFFEEKLLMDGFQVLKHNKSRFSSSPAGAAAAQKDANRVLYLEVGSGAKGASERWLVCARTKPDPKADKRFRLLDVSQAQAVPNQENRFYVLGGSGQSSSKRLLELEVPNRQARDGIVHHLNAMLSSNRKQTKAAGKQPVYVTSSQ
jgi:hypothetical protein